MVRRTGKYTIIYDESPSILGYASVAGKRESEGPLGDEFDRVFEDAYLGKPSFEQAESEMQKQVLDIALSKAEVTPDQVDYLFAGDLLNQCSGSTYGMAGFGIPYIGIYGACSTMALGLALSSAAIEGGFADITANVTSSHFASSERQFRYPLEYGGQRTPSNQWTATAAGAVILGRGKKGIRVRGVTIGRITDFGIKDANNMGAVMAPAAASTLTSFFTDTGTVPADYDLILTGDLGKVGSRLVCELCEKDGMDISSNHADCGLNIFHMNAQDVHSGGSGCGCSAAVLCSRVLRQMSQGELHNVLFCATGSLHSPTTVFQGLTLPGIAHLVWLSA